MGKFGWWATLIAVCGLFAFVSYYMGLVATVVVGVLMAVGILLAAAVSGSDE